MSSGEVLLLLLLLLFLAAVLKLSLLPLLLAALLVLLDVSAAFLASLELLDSLCRSLLLPLAELRLSVRRNGSAGAEKHFCGSVESTAHPSLADENAPRVWGSSCGTCGSSFVVGVLGQVSQENELLRCLGEAGTCVLVRVRPEVLLASCGGTVAEEIVCLVVAASVSSTNALGSQRSTRKELNDAPRRSSLSPSRKLPCNEGPPWKAGAALRVSSPSVARRVSLRNLRGLSPPLPSSSLRACKDITRGMLKSEKAPSSSFSSLFMSCRSAVVSSCKVSSARNLWSYRGEVPFMDSEEAV